MSKSKIKRIGITLGDPKGIGSEVTFKALSNPRIRTLGVFYVIGDSYFHKIFLNKKWPNVHFIDCQSVKNKSLKTISNKTAGIAALSYLAKSVELIQSNTINSIVTAPVSKENICLSEPSFVGHTEFFAKSFKTKHVDMMFIGKNMRTVIVTRHIPLKDVSKSLSKKLIIQTFLLVYASLKTQFKIRSPRIGVCGLNPHAGENGRIGLEEQKMIIPAINSVKKKNIRISGPFSADTIFTPKMRHQFDCIIAMYHDQGLIPIKSNDFNDLVNLTIGLPFIRTSPAHGTAVDIAGKNKANATSMIQSIKLAAELKA